MTQSEHLVQAILDSPDPIHKLVFADWLEDHGSPNLAYAYRWAGRRGKHPLATPAGRFHAWWYVPARQPKSRPAMHELPRPVYDALRPRPRGQHYRSKSLPLAFQRLAEALRVLRRAVDLETREK